MKLVTRGAWRLVLDTVLVIVTTGFYCTRILNNSGADTGGVDRVDIHPPFFSKKKFEMSLYLK